MYRQACYINQPNNQISLTRCFTNKALLAAVLAATVVACGENKGTEEDAQSATKNVSASTELMAKGERLYLANCAVCHQANGLGVPGVHPPLDQTEWVLGSKERLINIALNGMEGKIEVHGEIYDGVMPALPHIRDDELAAILSYVRNSFGNQASVVSAAEVQKVRAGESLNETSIDFSQVKPVNDYSERRKLVKNRVQSRIGNAFVRGEMHMETLKVPEGFNIEVFAEGLKNPRSMTLGDQGTLFVGTRKNKTEYVYAIRDEDQDGKADSIRKISRGLKWRPFGVAMRGKDLYVGEIDRIVVFRDIEANLDNPPEPELIFNYPPERKHGDKYIRFGPDDKLYVPVGAPCNSCLEENPVFSSITRINPDGTGFEVFAHGVRNSRGYDWHPTTGHMWFSDNGRDHMGDDTPPCEVNIAPKADMHFGFPFCHGKDIIDPEFGEQRGCDEFVPTTFDLNAHVAPVSLLFYTGDMFPEEYRNQILVSEHGSWNRVQKQGYRIALLRIEGDTVVRYENFAWGWLDEEKNDAWGRPADILQLPDGSILLSDDYAGAIYRISYSAP